jgi:two-component system NtrC family response regulator
LGAAGEGTVGGGRVLIIEDDEAVRAHLRWGLCERYELWLAEDGDAARAALRSRRFDAASLDLGLPPDPEGRSEGFRLLEELLAHDPAMKVVVVTADGERQHTIRAIQAGAFDYCVRPVKLAELDLILQRACRLSRLEREGAGALAGSSTLPAGEIVGETAAMRRVLDTMRRIAATEVTVLLSGETGTGKEMIARTLHAGSPRRGRPFVAIDCGAIPASLVEGELFGQAAGAGGSGLREGRLKLADGGTVFLDEIDGLPAPAQVKLLRLLQERRLERAGGRAATPVDIRVLAATDADLRQAVREGRFRDDLYYRLAVVRIDIPPLRERLEDMRLLAQRFLERISAEYHMRPRPFSADALSAMHGHPWPGNVRELENRIRRAVILAAGRRITAADLELDGGRGASVALSLRAARNEAERRVLVEAMQRHRGNISQAARAVQISRPAFHELLAKHGLRALSFKPAEPEKLQHR